MGKDEFRFLHRLRVRWGEIDAQRIVFFPHYLAYCNVASTEYWRAVGVPYPEGFAVFDGDLYLRKATVEYVRSARYDDELQVGLACSRVGDSSLTIALAIFRDEDLVVRGELISVFADVATQRPKSVPGAIRAALEAFEGGPR